MMRKAALVVLVIAIAAIAAAYAAAIAAGATERHTAWVMAVATSFVMIAIIALGAARGGRRRAGLGPLLFPFLIVLLLMLGAFTAALLLPAEGEPIVLGLPLRAAIVLYGVGVLPALILPVAYALTFGDSLTEEDIARVREAARRRDADS